MTAVTRITRELVDDDRHPHVAAVQAALEGPGRLEEIATLIRALTYGEMIELSSAMWKLQPEGSTLDVNNLPALLHRWSTKD